MTKADRMRAAFKEMCFSGDLVNLVVAPDALSAKIAERSGFKAIFQAGYATSANKLAQPDRGIADFGLMSNSAREIINAVDIPVFIDADTGYGDEQNIARLVRVYENMGAAGLFIEDQTWPKRCGHMDGKTIVPEDVMISKLKAAVNARQHDDFLIMSRTDAYAVTGLQSAIDRSRHYHEAGADLVFVDAPKTKADMQKVADSFPDVPVMANMIENGKTPLMTNDEIHDMGFSIAVHPNVLVYTEAFATERLLKDMVTLGTTKNQMDQMVTFPQFNKFIGLDDINALEQKYATAPIQL
ncbi:isocitrate lyase/PEP mutase family protein [Secundilactobacillus paracollinoides]|uniref:Carboxyvinyl-carboxyphosphonate phosphorylmutase n=1 Tax=Secundilactobacillus paracollinoides TaxID=240427 RepID=A0A1B2IXE0_9LACO|nr:isocitrate lyase/PEP mutase family protein [Secundilactobacillus paracollinoides]ANZ60842.1 carboxyvinyl-carboxyphosphonate phosphorylmutase [Secundilactobacillus paracollinoides]ANZ66701.1 carboxyvinyl-carboxyphosphonate phosphorylmutase [Secundilactobacillus paracollinoides]